MPARRQTPPPERLAVLVASGDEVVDALYELIDAVERTAPSGLVGGQLGSLRHLERARRARRPDAHASYATGVLASDAGRSCQVLKRASSRVMARRGLSQPQGDLLLRPVVHIRHYDRRLSFSAESFVALSHRDPGWVVQLIIDSTLTHTSLNMASITPRKSLVVQRITPTSRDSSTACRVNPESQTTSA